jgi:hypothetical protein
MGVLQYGGPETLHQQNMSCNVTQGLKEIYVRIEPWNVRNHTSGLWKTAIREMAKYDL